MDELQEFEHIDVAVNDGVAVVVLDRPEVLNANDSKTHMEVAKAFQLLDVVDAVGAVIVTGAGRAFCTGSDLRAVGGLRGRAASEYVELDFRTKNAVAGCRKPVLAAINGYCYGGGFELALACDVRISSSAARFRLPEVELGTLPGSGALQRLPQIVGAGIAAEWVLLGREVDCDEAYTRGLVSRVVPADELLSVVHNYATRISSFNPDAVRYSKVALNPTPAADTGIAAAFHGMASRICHDNPAYATKTSGFANTRGEEVGIPVE